MSRGIAVATLAASVVVGLTASPAMAAFPGRNGLLAVAPLHGPGVMLMSADGTGRHRICPSGGGCPVAKAPRWSPDGQAIAFSSPAGRDTSAGTSVVYDDGSCLDCQPFGGSLPAFTSIPALLTTVAGGKVLKFGSDGLQKGTVASGHISDAVWSAEGKVAVVRKAGVLAGRPGHLRSFGPGSSPSWAPSGSRLAVARGGFVTVLGVRHHSVKRLARGTAPAFSPDGKRIAFIGPGHRLSIVSSSGGRVRRVASVPGRYVDWEPLVAHQPGCTAPPGSTTVASSGTAVVSADSARVPGSDTTAPAYLGCLRSTGRERLLARDDFQTVDSADSGSDFVTVGNFAAFVDNQSDPHYGGSSETVQVFDLSTGAQSSKLGGQEVGCQDYSYSCGSGADQLVLNASGFTAVHTAVSNFVGPQHTEQILAADSTGVHVEDSVTSAAAGLALLTGLQLSGNTLTWEHSGSPRSAQLN